MGQQMRYAVPFPRWRQSRVTTTLLAAADELPDLRIWIGDTDDERGRYGVLFDTEGDGGARIGGKLELESDDEGTASIVLDVGLVHLDAVEEADLVARTLTRINGGSGERSDEVDRVLDAISRSSSERRRRSSRGRTFATFDELRAWLVSVYDAELVDERAYLTWSWSDSERTQQIELQEAMVVDEPWVYLRSHFAPRDVVSPERALELSGDQPIASLVPGDVWALVIALPLAALGEPRLSTVLDHLAEEADGLEEQLVGTDEH